MPGGSFVCADEVCLLAPTCGDGQVEGDEECDCGDSEDRRPSGCGTINSDMSPGACRTNCRLPSCGDGVVDEGESCDDGNLVPQDGCSDTCMIDGCGDGVRTPPEDCEGADLAGKTCEALGYETGTLGCTSFCRFDRSGCAGFCGDGVVGGIEECDQTDLQGSDCIVQGFYGGNLRCNDYCRLDLSACEGYCGDDEVNGPERCDGGDLGGRECLDVGNEYGGGRVACRSDCELDVSRCWTPGWSVAPAMTNRTLRGLWRASRKLRLAVGDGGLILRYDGTSWNPMASGTLSDLHGVWGFAEDAIVAVGAGGSVLRFDGTAWTVQDSGVTADLSAIWGSSTDHLFAVGASGTVLRWNGNAWSAIPTGTAADLRAVWGVAPDHVYAVGSGGTVLHCNASACIPVVSGTSRDLHGVWGTSMSNLIVVGDQGTIRHFDGASWTAAALGTSARIRAIHGGSRHDVFAVGDQGQVWHLVGAGWHAVDGAPGVELHSVWVDPLGEVHVVGSRGSRATYGGSAQIEQLTAGVRGNLSDVWGSSGSDVWVVGGLGRIEHFDGVSWTVNDLGVTSSLNAVHGTGLSDVWVAGRDLWHFDGMRWVWHDSPSPLPLLRLWFAHPDAGVAVGYSSIVDWDGAGWSMLGADNDWSLRAVCGFGPGSIIAVGAEGLILRYEGSAFTILPSPGNVVLADALCLANGTAWVVGSGGTVARVEGASVTTVSLGGVSFTSVWGSEETDLYLATASTVYRFDGSTMQLGPRDLDGAPGIARLRGWPDGVGGQELMAVGVAGSVHRRVESGWTSRPLPELTGRAVWGASVDDLFMVGSFGQIIRYQDGIAESMDSGTSADLIAVWGRTADDVFAVGRAPWTGTGVVVHFDGISWREDPLVPAVASYLSVWGTATGGTFVLGVRDGLPVVAEHDGTSWVEHVDLQPAAGPQFQGPGRIWGTSGSNVYLAADRLYRYDGASWSEVFGVSAADLIDVWGTDVSSVFAARRGGAILRFDGWTWSETNAASGSCGVLAGYGGPGAFALRCDSQEIGFLRHFDGEAWSTLSTTTPFPCHGLWGHPSAALFLACGDLFRFSGRVP
jgi:cysteine-rich repeat protein